MMSDLIPRAAAIEAFDDERVDRNYGDVSPESVIEVIESIPAVDAAPVVHSHWVYKERHRSSYRLVNGYDAMGEMHSIMVHEESDGKEPYCARCGAAAAESFMDYCPRCGAKMDGERRDEDGTVSWRLGVHSNGKRPKGEGRQMLRRCQRGRT